MKQFKFLRLLCCTLCVLTLCGISPNGSVARADATPPPLTLEIRNNGLTNQLAWQAVPGAIGYEVLCGQQGKFRTLTTIYATRNEKQFEYTHIVDAKGKYTYKVIPLAGSSAVLTVYCVGNSAPGQTLRPTAAPTPTPTVSTAASTATTVTSAAVVSSRVYKQGDSDDGVLKIKLRLQELGYYRASSTFDSSYNATMAERVKLFQKENSLPQTGEVDATTYSALFSASAKRTKAFATPTPRPTSTPKPTATPYVEPRYALKDTGGGSCGTSYGNPWFRLEVKNDSAKKTVDGFTIAYYATNLYGEKIKAFGFGDTVQEEIISLTVKPGQKKTTNRITAYGFEGAKRIYQTIVKIHFTDGTTVEIPSFYQETWYNEY